jgi:hypothetical protein
MSARRDVPELHARPGLSARFGTGDAPELELDDATSEQVPGLPERAGGTGSGFDVTNVAVA